MSGKKLIIATVVLTVGAIISSVLVLALWF